MLKREKMTDNRPFQGQPKSSRPSPALSDITRCWGSRLVDMPTATSDSVKVTGLAERLVETAKAFRPEYIDRSFCARLGGRHVGVWALGSRPGTMLWWGRRLIYD